MPAPTALVLRALGLGDLVTGLPALRMLRAALPEHRLVLAAPRWWWPLVRRAGVVDDLVHGHELEPLVDAPVAPALAVDLHGNGPASRALLEATGPRRTVAYDGGNVRWDAGEHEVRRWCRLVAEGLPTDVEAPGVGGSLGPPPETGAPPGRTIVHCGAAAASRRWPPTRFATVAMLLAGEGHDVLVTAGAAERDIADAVARAAGVECAVQPPVEELCDVVGHARLVISGDTGIAHLAAAYEVPSVTLFGPVSPRLWGPPDHPRHQVVDHGAGAGDPHGTSVDPALARIAVGDVVAAAHAALTVGVAHG